MREVLKGMESTEWLQIPINGPSRAPNESMGGWKIRTLNVLYLWADTCWVKEVSLISHKVVKWVMLCLGNSFIHLSTPKTFMRCPLCSRWCGAKLGGCFDGIDDVHVTQAYEVLCIPIKGKIVKVLQCLLSHGGFWTDLLAASTTFILPKNTFTAFDCEKENTFFYSSHNTSNTKCVGFFTTHKPIF